MCSSARPLQICEAYGANRYPFPEEGGRRRQMMTEVTSRLMELHTTIDAGEAIVWTPPPSHGREEVAAVLCGSHVPRHLKIMSYVSVGW